MNAPHTTATIRQHIHGRAHRQLYQCIVLSLQTALTYVLSWLKFANKSCVAPVSTFCLARFIVRPYVQLRTAHGSLSCCKLRIVRPFIPCLPAWTWRITAHARSYYVTATAQVFKEQRNVILHARVTKGYRSCGGCCCITVSHLVSGEYQYRGKQPLTMLSNISVQTRARSVLFLHVSIPWNHYNI